MFTKKVSIFFVYILPLFMRGKLGTTRIYCDEKISKKACLFTFSSKK